MSDLQGALLEKLVQDFPYSAGYRMVLADWYEENGLQDQAFKTREYIGELDRWLIDKMDLAITTRKWSKRRAENWLAVWKEHSGVDKDWDNKWLLELELY